MLQQIIYIYIYICVCVCVCVCKTNLVVWLSEFLTTDHEVPGSIPGSVMGIFS
jgi:hypothetical protein